MFVALIRMEENETTQGFNMKKNSLDMLKWLELPEVTESELELVDTVKSRFSGDPALEHRLGKSHSFFTG